MSVFLSLPLLVFLSLFSVSLSLDFSLSVSPLSFQVCVCVCPFTVAKPFLSELGLEAGTLGSEVPLGQKEQEDKRLLPPQPLQPRTTPAF